MHDIHAPHESIQSWRQFLVHMTTITLGLLIAVGLEQSVEAIHRHHEAVILRDALNVESVQVLADARRTVVAQEYERNWLATRITQVRGAVWEQRALEPRKPNQVPYYASPDIPIWRSAKAGSRLQLLTSSELEAFAEVEYVQTHVDLLAIARNEAESAVTAFVSELPTLPNGDPDFAKPSPQDLRSYLSALTAALSATETYLTWLHDLIGAELAITKGNMRLEDIYASEREASGHGDGTRPAM